MAETLSRLVGPLLALLSEGPRRVFLAKCFFGGGGHQGQHKTHLAETNVFLALPSASERPKHQLILENVVLFLPWYPQASKTILGQQKHLRIPLTGHLDTDFFGRVPAPILTLAPDGRDLV